MKKLSYIILQSILILLFLGCEPKKTVLEFKEVEVFDNQKCDSSDNFSLSSAYKNNCAGCHGKTGGGSGIAPALDQNKISQEKFVNTVRSGIGSMPAFSSSRIDNADLVNDFKFLYENNCPQVIEGPSPAGENVDEGQERFNKFTGIINNKCVGCHNNGLNGNFSILQTESDWIASPFLTPNSLKYSSVYTRLKGSKEGNLIKDMPKGAGLTLTADEMTAVEDWINNIVVEDVAFTGISPRMGNRVFVNSILDYIFGTSLTSSVSQTNGTASYHKILDNHHVFQGPCDLYALNVGSGEMNNPTGDKTFWCRHNAKKSRVEIIGKTNPIRHGYLTQVCELYTQDTTSMAHALQKIHNHTTGDLTVNHENLEKAYQAFYPEKNIPLSYESALLEIANAVGDNSDQWKWIYLTNCLSSEWQVP